MKKNCLVLICLSILLFVHGIYGQEILSLDQCVEIALKNNSQLKNAERSTNIAKAGVTSSYSGILPQVDASVTAGRYHQADVENLRDIPVEYAIDTLFAPVLDPAKETLIGWGVSPKIGAPTRYEQRLIVQQELERDSYRFSFDVNQNVFDGGRWWNAIRQAKAEHRAAIHSQESMRQFIIRTASEAYYNLLKQLNLKKVYAEALRSAEEQYKRTESMYEIGSVAQADVFKAKVSVGEAQSNLIYQNNTIIGAEYELNFVMGREPKTPIQIVEPDVTVEPFELDDSEIEQAINKNPELKQLEEKMKSSEYALKIAKGVFWPVLGVGGSYSRWNPEAKRVYTGFDKNYYWQIGASVQLNLFNGFRDKANWQTRQMENFIAKENLAEQKRQLKSDVTNAHLRLEAFKEITEINQENLKSAEEDLRMAQERYRVGAGTLLDVLDAQVSVTTARGTLVRAKYDAMSAKADLEYYMGIIEK